MSFTSFQPTGTGILDAAFTDYAKQIGVDPSKHPFFDQFQFCHSPSDVLMLLEDKANEFRDYREGNRKLINCLKPVVEVIHALSGVRGEVISFVPFQPAGAIFVGVDVLLTAASDVSSSYDALVDLFECLGDFLKRLRIYSGISLTPLMTEVVVKIMAELLSVLTLATKQIQQGRFKKFAKKLLGESEIEAVLQRLDRLTQEEGQMTMAQTLEVVHCLMNNVGVVMNDGKASIDGIWKALDAMQQIVNDINKMKREQLQEKSQIWLSPPDPSPNFNLACEIHQEGTATWLFRGSVFGEWFTKSSLLWIHGKPGSGKTILTSSIIREINKMHNAGLASMAYFYFDLRDPEKQHRRGLLSSLLSQLSADSDPYSHILSCLYSDHAGGTRQPSDDALWKCLVEMLKVQGRPPIYVIIDALDECPDISGIPTARENVLMFLKDLVGLHLPNMYICISSRPEIDIRTTLEPLASFHLSLDDESGQKEDISKYIKSVVHSDQKLLGWSAEHKQLVIDALSNKADGMFRWVYCQLEDLRQHFPEDLQSALDHMPESLDESYERALLRIDKAKRQSAHRLFQCLAVSVRPLRVDELAEILESGFDAADPNTNTVWQPINAEEGVLSACSSLIVVNGSQVVQFSHGSVKEFLTSDRLATAGANLSHYHIVPHLADAVLAQASLGVLLQLDDRIDKDSIRNFPLADYAARYWFKHVQLENVSSTIQETTERLFDREKPHFSAWIWIYDIDDPWRKSMPTKHPEQPEAVPLYYAILCGFRWLIDHLIVTYPGDVNARGGRDETPLLTAVRKENSPLHHTSPSRCFDIVQFLLEHNADVNLPGQAHDVTPLHAAVSGKVEISRLLVQKGADVHSRDKGGRTPLGVASYYGHPDVIRFLIDNGADVNSRDNQGWTPLHLASQEGHVDIVELLIQHGADVNAQNDHQVTPLYLASANGKLEISRLLVQQGADVRSRVKGGQTPLQIASEHGHLDVIRFLHDSGADVNSGDDEGWTPLHSASQEGHVDIVELLIQHGANVNTQNDHQVTPLHLALANRKLEVSRLLIQHGADVRSRNKDGWTPLQTASEHGHLDIVRFLIDSGADANSRDNEGWTPLHSASQEGHVDTVELLIRHGADVNAQSDDQVTPLHTASANGKLEILQLLIQQGAGVHSRDKSGRTPLRTASYRGYLDGVQFLIDSGADVNSRDNQGWTPLHWASRGGHVDIVELLIQHGVDVNVQGDDQVTPLFTASENGKLEISRLLLQQGADVHSRDKHDWTPLQAASYDGHPDVVQFLIDSGADVNSRDIEGWTPLHSATQGGHVDVVEILIQHGADVNAQSDQHRVTPFLMASAHGKLEILRLFVQQGADVHSWDKGGLIALQTASLQGHLDVVRFLIDGGADVNFRNIQGWTPLHLASQGGHVDIVELLTQHGADVNAQNDDQVTPLHTASFHGELEVSRLLVQQGADVYSRNKDGWTPLTLSSFQGHLDVVRFLFDSGADANSRDNEGFTPLHLASHGGHVDIVELLIQHGADINAQNDDQVTPLYTASENGELEVLRLLVQQGADMRSRAKGDQTPLQTASEHGHLDVVRFLIDGGVDVNSCNIQGFTPLHWASQEGHVDIVDLLIQHGADVNAHSDLQATLVFPASVGGGVDFSWQPVKRGAYKENGGCTPLQAALYTRHLDIARFLIDAGADLNTRGDRSSTLLHSAGQGYLNTLKLLLKRGADFSIQDRMSLDLASNNGKPRVADFLSGHIKGLSFGGAANATLSTISPQNRHPAVHPPRKPQEDATPSDNGQCESLYIASQNGQLDIVRSLLDRGTDVNESSTFRATALHAASRYGKIEVAKLLIERGADVDPRGRSGLTPLITALQYGQFEVAKLLLDHGADVNVDTGGLTTALHIALSSGHLEFIRLLLERGAKVDVPDVDGLTPRQLATHLELYRQIVEMFSDFEEHGECATVQPPPPIISKGSPTPHSARASTLADAPVSAPPAPAPASATRFAVDPTVSAPPFVSSHVETAWQPRDDTSRDLYREKSVGDRLQPIITATTAERKKAAQTARWAGWASNVAISGQVIICAIALGAAFRGKNKSVAISILSGVSTFVTSYSACTRGSDERQASLLRAEALDRFLCEVEAFQLIHGKEVSREWDEKIDGFRLGLENMLGNQPGSVMINSEAAGINSSVEKGVGATDPVSA